MFNKNFAGHKKEGESLLVPIENKLVNFLLPKVPGWLQTYHLTLLTIAWSAFIVVMSYLAKFNIHWLWGVSVMILLQYLSDLLDGKVGKMRNTGLVRWGYYMDHFLDYVFLCSILIGYSFILPDHFKYLLFFILVIFGAFMVNAYLSFAATNKFKISFLGIGPTEIRIIFIVINTLIIFGKQFMGTSLPYVLLFSFVGLCIVVFRTQKKIWKIDMEIKNKQNKNE